MENLKSRWVNFFEAERSGGDWWERKKALYKKRNAEIVRIQGDGRIIERSVENHRYLLHLTLLIKQKGRFFIEEKITPYQFQLQDGYIREHKEVPRLLPVEQGRPKISPQTVQFSGEQRFTYDRLAAVKYAERWWNSYNPAYKKFAVDCTNYVSQCLLAGGAPMRGAPVREEGWWYQDNNWSFSWAVAHSMRWYLSGSTQGLKGSPVETAGELQPGDIICYDFQGDGRWDHNTIVVAKDADDMPLVNAHTDNSRNRYWSYEDSTAWTPDIQYKFFRIGE